MNYNYLSLWSQFPLYPISIINMNMQNYKREEMNDMQDNIVWENQFSDPPMKTDFDAAWGTLQGTR